MKFLKDKVNIVFPISGRGQRFKDAGFDDPKPFIEVFDKYMIEWAIKSCDFLNKLTDYKLIFTVRQEHVDLFQIDKKLESLFGPEVLIVPIDTNNYHSGQAAHVLAAKDYINNNDRLFIYSCDTFSLSPIAEMIEQEDPDGILPCFISSEEKFSYAKLNKEGYVCETAEKKPISNLATTGHYYFKRGADFVWATEEMIKKGESFNGEYYVAPCYNPLIQLGRKIKVVMVTENWVMGTPEELAIFLKNYPSQKNKNGF